MTPPARPRQVLVFCLLFVASAIVMLLLGIDAHAYALCAIGLAAQAVLLWRGAARSWFLGLFVLNLLSAVVLIGDLWLGDALHLPKLTISAAMLAGNLLLGGPLMGVMAGLVLGAMVRGGTVAAWFAAHRT